MVEDTQDVRDKVVRVKSLLVARATQKQEPEHEAEYVALRGELMGMPEVRAALPQFVRECGSKRREDGLGWSVYLEQRLARITIRKAPLWNQGLIEGSWLIRFDSKAAKGTRVSNLAPNTAAGDAFIGALLAELHLREPAIPIAPPATP